MTRFTSTYRRIATRLRRFVSSRGLSRRHKTDQLQRIIDKLQVVVLMKPTTLSLIENVLDGILERMPKDGRSPGDVNGDLDGEGD